jgi:acyl-CoA thioester hydrolase
MDLSNLPITNQKTIPEDYIDLMGHMNVMWYTHLFDIASFNFFELFGFGHEYYTETGNGGFALEQHTRYLAEVRLGESVTVHTRALNRTVKRFHFMHFLVKDESGELAATTELVGTHVDMSIRRTSPLPEKIAADFDEILAAHAQFKWEAPICGAMGA